MSKMMTAKEKELREREKIRRSWPRLELASQYSGEMIYVNRRIYDGVLKKVNMLSMKVVGGAGGKLVIEYESKRGGSRGVLELNDIGPAPMKKEKC